MGSDVHAPGKRRRRWGTAQVAARLSPNLLGRRSGAGFGVRNQGWRSGSDRFDGFENNSRRHVDHRDWKRHAPLASLGNERDYGLSSWVLSTSTLGMTESPCAAPIVVLRLRGVHSFLLL